MIYKIDGEVREVMDDMYDETVRNCTRKSLGNYVYAKEGDITIVQNFGDGDEDAIWNIVTLSNGLEIINAEIYALDRLGDEV